MDDHKEGAAKEDGMEEEEGIQKGGNFGIRKQRGSHKLYLLLSIVHKYRVMAMDVPQTHIPSPETE